MCLLVFPLLRPIASLGKEVVLKSAMAPAWGWGGACHWPDSTLYWAGWHGRAAEASAMGRPGAVYPQVLVLVGLKQRERRPALHLPITREIWASDLASSVVPLC